MILSCLMLDIGNFILTSNLDAVFLILTLSLTTACFVIGTDLMKESVPAGNDFCWLDFGSVVNSFLLAVLVLNSGN